MHNTATHAAPLSGQDAHLPERAIDLQASEYRRNSGRRRHSDEVKGKNIIMIAGPNGAGKTTFAREFLPQEADCPTFINADLIAQGLSPFRPETAAVRAGRLMLEMVAACVRRRESFAIETTLSGRGYARMIPQWKRAGYEVTIFFLAIPSVELAIRRVAIRVAQGGHDVPEAVIRRRFQTGRANFLRLYKPLADAWRHYDNSGEKPLLLASSDEP